MTRRILLALMLFLTPALALAQSIAGTYTAEGRNPSGQAYSGKVVITEAGSRVTVKWFIGSETYDGDGTRSQDVVTINWGDTWPIYYLVLPSGELHGTWGNGTALERLIPN